MAKSLICPRALSDEGLHRLLADDVPGGDLTTETLAIGACAGRVEFRARGAMRVCASEEAVRMFELVGAGAVLHVPSSSGVEAGTLLLEATGSAATLHQAWKVAQTLMEWASGIASSAAEIVAAAAPVAVACTRKNVPGTKAMSVKAVKAGGAIMHRLGLSETLLLFAEHRLFLDESPQETAARLRRAQPERKITVEVGSVAEALVWARAGAGVLQLEKFSPGELDACRQGLRQEGLAAVLVAAGGVNAGNAPAYVAAGADLIATSAPYSAPPRDVQVRFFRA